MAIQIEKILFATDLSDNSRLAFQYASTIAACCNARLILLHVMPALPSGLGDRLDFVAGEGTTARLRENHRNEARELLIGKRKEDHRIRSALNQFYSRGTGDSEASFEDVEILVREGEIDQEILRCASEFKCDLIAMGSHKGLMGGTAVGGKAKSILHHSTVPVLIVPPPETV
jgi:nucleotide-binding universal stress UspA family protein